jgi:hypothetical protein
MALTEVQQHWVDALRSGEYEQCEGGLRNKKDKRCCLGVLTQLYIDDGHELRASYSNVWGKWEYGENKERNYLLPEVTKWAGLANNAGGYQNRALTDDNDSGKTFAEIADIIEANADTLFISFSEG